MTVRLDFSPHFHVAQQEAYNMLTRNQGGIVWHKAGEGKTRVGLAAGYDIARQQDKPIILFVCRRIAFDDVERDFTNLQMQRHADFVDLELINPDLKFKKPTVVLMSWGMWETMTDWVSQRLSQIGCVILDEGWLYKNPQTYTHKLAAMVCCQACTILMSGSIMPAKNVVDIYGQVRVIGRGSSLATTLSGFRTKYQMGIGGDFFSWYPKKGAYKEIITAISPFTHIHFPPDSGRLLRTAIKKVEPTKQQTKYFQELKDYAAIEDKFELNSQAAVVIKAQQISGGWLKREDGEIEYLESNKIAATIAELEELFYAEEKRVVIWCAFREDINRLVAELEPHFPKLQICKMSGSHTFDEAKWTRSKTAICLATMQSGSSFNYFGQVPYAIYFSQDWKWMSLDQSQRRHVRKDSAHTSAHFTFLHTIGSLDDKVYYTVKSAASTERTFIRQLDVAQWIRT